MGLNELKLGLPVPYLADLMLRQIVGDRAATPIVFGGEFLTMPSAHDVGLVDETVSDAILEDHALEHIEALAVHPTTAFGETKAVRTEDVRNHYAQHSTAKNNAFLSCWFSEEGQARLHEASKKF